MKYTDEQIKAFGLNRESIPAHVAIIMDGNGRWAKQRGIPRALGHRAGVTRLKEIIRFSSDIGVKALSLYAFSTENWARPKTEIDALCSLFVEFFNREFDELNENNVCIRAL
jgi:undecaprenyl diphosphate synthase